CYTFIISELCSYSILYLSYFFTFSISFFLSFFFFFFHSPATTEIYTLSLHDALPISARRNCRGARARDRHLGGMVATDWHDLARSEEHTSELQSLRHLVCRLLLEKKKKKKQTKN